MPTIFGSALLDLGEAIKIPPRVFGALLWEHTTGLPYLSAQSDLDLLWLTSEELTAHSLVERLRQLDAESPVRLDGELELPDGAGVNWPPAVLLSLCSELVEFDYAASDSAVAAVEQISLWLQFEGVVCPGTTCDPGSYASGIFCLAF